MTDFEPFVQNATDEVIEMYKQLNMWEECIAVAEAKVVIHQAGEGETSCSRATSSRSALQPALQGPPRDLLTIPLFTGGQSEPGWKY